MEQEPTMDEILSSIRRILSAEQNVPKIKEIVPDTPVVEPVEKVEKKVYMLTPEMRVDSAVARELKPIIQTWLRDNLPPLVEKIVREEVRSVLSKGLK